VIALGRAAVPPELHAIAPPEARGLARDGVRLLVAGGGGIDHVHFCEIGRFLREGDLLVVNTSATIPAALDGVELLKTSGAGVPAQPADRPVIVHFSTELDDGTWVIELRTAPAAETPLLDATAGEQIALPAGACLTVLSPYPETPEAPRSSMRRAGGGHRLWRVRPEIPGGDTYDFLAREGRPIRYGHVPQRWPLSSYQTMFAAHPGSAEMPGAGRPFTSGLVTQLIARGITFAPIILHTGVSSLDGDEPPYPERFEVSDTTAQLIEATRRAGGRVLAVGTTVVRAIESAVLRDGSLAAASGWTDVVLGPTRPARVVDGLVSGWHDPASSHMLLLEAVVGSDVLDPAYIAALDHRYLWHEFGDACLLLRPDR